MSRIHKISLKVFNDKSTVPSQKNICCTTIKKKGIFSSALSVLLSAMHHYFSLFTLIILSFSFEEYFVIFAYELFEVGVFCDVSSEEGYLLL